MSNDRPFPIRSFVWSVVLVTVAAAGIYLAYELVVKPQRALQDQISEEKETILKLEQEKQRLEAYLKILKRIDRRARIEVLRQTTDPQGNLQTTIRFTEIDDTGKPMNVSREMTLPGPEVYFDTLVIKFDDHFIEQGDPLKGRALMLFRRIFSSTMRAEDGFIIDTEGQAPEAYAGRQAPSAFEQELWRRFWELANDAKLAKEHGVRAIHGDAPYMRLEPDRVYEICLRSTGEVIITPGTRLEPPPNDSVEPPEKPGTRAESKRMFEYESHFSLPVGRCFRGALVGCKLSLRGSRPGSNLHQAGRCHAPADGCPGNAKHAEEETRQIG